MATNDSTKVQREINMLPDLGRGKDGKQIINTYNFAITNSRLSLSTNPFTDVIEPQLILEVINLDGGYRTETVKKVPTTIEGDVAIGQKFILRGPTLGREYYEPKDGGDLSKYQQFVFALTGGITKEDAKKILDPEFLFMKQFTAGVEIKTSQKGNQYMNIVSWGESDDLEIPAKFDDTLLLEELSDSYKEWDLATYPLETLWQKAEIPTTEAAYFSVFADNVRTTLLDGGFSLKALDPNRVDDKGENKPIKWIVYLKQDESGNFIKTRMIDNKAVKEVLTIEKAQKAFDYANSLGLVPASDEDLLNFLAATETSEHYEFLNNWVDAKMPGALQAGHVQVGAKSGGKHKVGLKKLSINAATSTSNVPISVDEMEVPDIE